MLGGVVWGGSLVTVALTRFTPRFALIQHEICHVHCSALYGKRARTSRQATADRKDETKVYQAKQRPARERRISIHLILRLPRIA
jgi:hypothetical protein